MDGAFLNPQIIKQGYGFAYTKYLSKDMEEFRTDERGRERLREGCGNQWINKR